MRSVSGTAAQLRLRRRDCDQVTATAYPAPLASADLLGLWIVIPPDALAAGSVFVLYPRNQWASNSHSDFTAAAVGGRAPAVSPKTTARACPTRSVRRL